ncbi:transmembrane protein 184B-like [Centruroides sculpturatus]|uniref:transmembrane protein 184B-like n=1 Tax=Centruroides sculpturatus TaxID=218467 RepID=UPI000C6D0CB2|nr:transmembrane protein 184B-like [Centruroides sculpturatus]
MNDMNGIGRIDNVTYQSSDLPVTAGSNPETIIVKDTSDNSTFGNGTIVEIPPIFLQTNAAQTISGAFVWAALIITCHQVKVYFEYMLR